MLGLNACCVFGDCEQIRVVYRSAIVWLAVTDLQDPDASFSCGNKDHHGNDI
jgi:hypothetical protein